MKVHKFGLGGYEIEQLPAETDAQKMGYLISAPDGTLVAVDGGWDAEADATRARIQARGGKVALWLMTHCHSDHVCAPLEILRAGDVPVARVCHGFPSAEWLDEREPTQRDVHAAWEVFTPTLGARYVKACADLRLEVGGMVIECLNDPFDMVDNPPADPEGYSLNDSSAIFKVTFPNGVTALFPGDCGLLQGERLADTLGDRLHADIVEMAHHGQNGASRRFYECVRPTFCFWDAPAWLWENDAGDGFDTGPWKTVATRRWMASLGVIRHAVLADGGNLLV